MRVVRTVVRLALLGGTAVLVGCATPGPGPLYMWEAFPRVQYDTLLRESSNPQEQIRMLEAHAEKARAASASLPPGMRAHLGMLYLSVGNPERAQTLWRDEKTAFPESAPFMDQLLKRLDRSGGTTANMGNPA